MEKAQRSVSLINNNKHRLNYSRNNKHLMELKNIVYITINLCNGKFYIGVHKTNPNVFDGYIGAGIYCAAHADTNKKGLHKAVKKYGYHNFKRTTIACFPDTEEGRLQALDLEARLVNQTLLKSKNVYNIALGGKGSICRESKKRVYMFDLNGEFLRSYASALDAVRDLKCENLISAQHSIRNNCIKQSNSALGYYWSYIKKFDYNSNKVKIAQYTISGKFIRIWNSISEAEYELRINNIYNAIHKGGSSGNYQWKYYEGNDSNITPLINTNTKNKHFPIQIFDKKTGNFISEYNSVQECVKIIVSLIVLRLIEYYLE